MHKFYVAPMMDWTDRHCRYFHRLLAPSACLYTEMITAMTLAHGDHERLLKFDASEHPVVLQVGGSDPALMAAAAKKGEAAGFDAININIGCPSERVQNGSFGACLMAEPALVAANFSAMREAVNIPVTIKTRIGIDDQDNDEFFSHFVDTLADAGCTQFDVHARIAILKGLSPKQNRSVPPLNYERVYGFKRRRPELTVVLNGGVRTLSEAQAHLQHVDGVMLGREAYHNPWVLTKFEAAFGQADHAPTRVDIVHAMVEYAERELGRGASLKHITRHMLGLFSGEPGAKLWRRAISENAHLPEAGPQLLLDALAQKENAA